MQKWYEQEGAHADVIVASRIRLQRNLKAFPFPTKLTTEAALQLNGHLSQSLAGLQTVFGLNYDTVDLGQLSTRARTALQERQLISHGIVQKTSPVSMLLSKDESVSIVMNGDDHIRLQINKSGLNLNGAWAAADHIDDYINEKFEYAFDPKFGYMTTYPTHLGTGLRAYLLLHLPMFSASKRFPHMVREMGRFGLVMKNGFGPGDENYGDMYVIYNQKTMGQSETDLIAVVEKIGRQIMEQEYRLRELGLKNQRNAREDQCYRAYGILKYARSLTLKEALTQLSRLRLGVCMGLIELENPTSLFQLMQSSQPATIQTIYHREIEEEKLNRLRAEYIRSYLPNLKEEAKEV